MANGITKYSRVIAKRRNTRNRTENLLYLVLIYTHKHFNPVHIDQERLHVLTKIRKTKKGINIKESDHIVMVTEFDCKIQKEKETEKEKALYNLKNKDCQEKFKLFT